MAAGVTAFVLGTVSAATADTAVKFLELTDAGRPDSSMPPHRPRTPSIRTSSSSGSTPGFDRKTSQFSGFTASTAAFYLPHATDTISFVVEAPSGYYISTITYTQRGTGAIARSGKATGSSQWVVDNQPEDLGVFEHQSGTDRQG